MQFLPTAVLLASVLSGISAQPLDEGRMGLEARDLDFLEGEFGEPTLARRAPLQLGQDALKGAVYGKVAQFGYNHFLNPLRRLKAGNKCRQAIYGHKLLGGHLAQWMPLFNHKDAACSRYFIGHNKLPKSLADKQEEGSEGAGPATQQMGQ